MAVLGRYLTEDERNYLGERKEKVEQLGQGFLADNPFLFANRFIVTAMLVRILLFQQILELSGAVVECGVASGNHLMLFSHLSSVLEPYAINRRIIGFDSFEGFRSISSEDPEDVSERDFSEVSVDLLNAAIDLFDKSRPLGHMQKIELVKGDATETIPRYVQDHPELTIALLYLDFDLFTPTKAALDQLLPLVCKGGIVCMDEFNYDRFPGETQAVKESLTLRDVELKRFSFAPFVGYFRV
jgi:hypothetical protein